MAGLIDSTLEMAGTVKDAAGDAYNSAMNSIFGEKPEPAGRTLGKGVEKILGFRVRKDAVDKNAPKDTTSTKTLEVLEYPTECALNQPHLKIKIFEYKRDRRDQALALTFAGSLFEDERKIVTPISTIVLPITQSIVSSFDHMLTDLEGVGNAFADLGNEISAYATIGAEYAMYESAVLGAGAGALSAGAKIVAGRIGGSDGLLGTMAQQAGRSAGLALNPVTEVAYTKPGVRAHAFEFTMIPRNPEETSAIQQIISTLTASSMPTEVDNTFGMILNYPRICEVSFHAPKGWRIPGVIGIPDSFIQNVTFIANPVGGGRLMSDGTPVSYKLSVSFKELKSMTRDDYTILLEEASTITILPPPEPTPVMVTATDMDQP
jgi:hypothetical protein